MKGIRYKILAAAAVTAAIFLGTSSGIAFSDQKEKIVEDLVCRRTDAMSGYFASKLSYWEAGTQLKETESGIQLETDLKKMREFFRTDIEQVKAYEIRNIEFTLKGEDILCAVVEISWTAEGLDGEDRFETTHSVICERQAGKSDYKLVQFF
ncbi:MAG: hypothetical protein ACI4WY_09675 [Anaerovoracaceae bacterium]